MGPKRLFVLFGIVVAASAVSLFAQGGGQALQTPPAEDPIKTMVDQLDLDKYKATLKGLTQFGDRRQGTKRNRDASDWIAAQLKSYGYTNVERVSYDPPVPASPCGPSVPESVVVRPAPRAGGAGGARGAGAGRGRGGQPSNNAQGGGRYVGNRARTGVNCDPMAQPDERIRALDSGVWSKDPVTDVYVTKVGTKYPNEMYIVAAHMDGHGYNEAVNDDGSGTALVMEIARVFADPNVQTERSIRFALWNGEETGLNGAKAYVEQRQALQGIENPKGSGKYPEPKWVAMIQNDMMMWDHGMPVPQMAPDGKHVMDANGRGVFMAPKEQRLEADVNVEFQVASKFADDAMKLAFQFKYAGEKYATDYPVNVGPHMTNTDSGAFQDIVPSISLRENERGAQTGAGWNPTWHTPLDVWTTFSDKDFRLGLNAAQTTLSAVATLTKATVKK
jgi:hypothetical protein